MTIKYPSLMPTPNHIFCVVVSLLFSLTAGAVQTSAAYTYAQRFNLNGQVTGTISPDPTGLNRFPATRNTYEAGSGLLLTIEEGVLTTWKDETIFPDSWGGSFQAIRIQRVTYDDLGRKATFAILNPAGTAQTLTQYSYDGSGRVLCSAVRMTTIYNSLPESACTLRTQGNSTGPAGRGPAREGRRTDLVLY